MSYLMVALGGALGATARYGAGCLVALMWAGGFPLATMLVNILGSFVIGVLAARWPDADWWGRSLLVTGFLGGFTTFSSFSLEAMRMLERGAWAQLVLYVGGSVVLSLLAVGLGMMLGRPGITG